FGFTPLDVGVTVAGVIAAMASINLRLTLLAIAVVPGMALASLLLGRMTREAAYAQRDVEGEINAHVQQTLAGIPARVCWTWALISPSTSRCAYAASRVIRPSRSDASAMPGTTAMARSVSLRLMLAMAAMTPATVTPTSSGVKPNSSTTVWTHQESVPTRAIVSPIGMRLWSRSDRRCTRAKRSRARTNTIDWPTLIHRNVRATSRTLPRAKNRSSAPATHSRSTFLSPEPGRSEASVPGWWWPRTLSTRILRGRGVSRPIPVDSKVNARI